MHKRTLARLAAAGWSHPYGHGPFSPFLYADGGGGSPAGGNPPPVSPVPQPPAPPTAPPAPPAPGPAASTWDSFQWDGKVESLPADVAKVIREAREEAGKARTVAKANAAEEARQELLATISKAVGLDSGETPPTPEELTQQLTQSTGALTAAQERAAAAALELHVYKTAARLGANADALLDSRSFCDTIDNIDPSGTPEAFNAQVEKAITTALESNAQLRTGQAPRRGGGEFAGRPGTDGRPTSLGQAVAAGLASG